MQLTCHGAVRETTGSQHIVEVGGFRVLLDCGLMEGNREEAYQRNRRFPYDPKSIDAVILSHAHIDHSGNLPALVAQGFAGNIYSTFATRDLASILLQDSAKVQASDIEYVNRRRAKKGQTPFKPLYDAQMAEKAIRQFVTLDYHRPFPVGPGITATFFDAGHMLGSAQVMLELQEKGKKVRFLFSGDVGRGKADILRDPEYPTNIDVLLMESTYGDRLHEDLSTAKEELARIVRESIERRGKLLIPSFAVGRSQQIVYVLNQLEREGKIPVVPIYVDSPMATNATEVFRLHPECFNQQTYDFLQNVRNPFGWDSVQYLREASQSMKLNTLEGPAIIISASGMCEAGRILHHLQNHLGKPETTVLFIGHCAEQTLGARILAGQTPVNIFGEPVDVRARILKLNAFSGHADKNELVEYARRITGSKRRIFIVHGEADQSEALARHLQEARIGEHVAIPNLGQPAAL